MMDSTLGSCSRGADQRSRSCKSIKFEGGAAISAPGAMSTTSCWQPQVASRGAKAFQRAESSLYYSNDCLLRHRIVQCRCMLTPLALWGAQLNGFVAHDHVSRQRPGA